MPREWRRPAARTRARVLFEDGWEFGRVVSVGQSTTEENRWPIVIQFDGESEEDQESYFYPDEDILLESDEERVFEALQKGDVKLMEQVMSISRHLCMARDGIEWMPAIYSACLHKELGLLRAMLQAGGDPLCESPRGDRLLNVAITHKCYHAVQTLVEFSADISTRDRKGRNALHAAAATGDVRVLDILLRPTRNVCDFFTLIHGSLKEVTNDEAVMLQLDTPVETPPEPDSKGNDGDGDDRGSVGEDAKQRQGPGGGKLDDDKAEVKIIRRPGERTAEARGAKGEEGKIKRKKQKEKEKDKEKRKGSLRTALHIAAMKGHVEFVRRLCLGGADVNALDQNQRTPLHLACLHLPRGPPRPPARQDGGRMQGVVRELFRAKADLHLIDKNGQTPFALACAVGRIDAAEAVRSLKPREWHVIVNRKDSKGSTPLAHACRRGDVPLLKLLLQCNADPNMYDLGRMFPLHVCALSGNRACAEALVRFPTAVDEADVRYWYHVIEPLGARYFTKPDLKSPKVPRQGAREGSLIRAVAKKNGWLKCENSLWVPTTTHPGLTKEAIGRLKAEERPSPIVSPFMHACPVSAEEADTPPKLWETAKDEEEAKAAVDEDMLVDGAEEIAADRKSSKKIQLKVQMNSVDILGRTALHSAAGSGDINMGRFLLDQKANIDARDNDGITPLYLAANERKVRFVRLLVNRRADLRIPRNDGWTPLHISSAFAEVEIVGILLNAGANPTSMDKYGSIPLQCVEHGGDESERVASLLQKAMNTMGR